ncbi:hypothetical protein F5B21DRAFT_467733 [Xylaria acuta]|nr:hypothetical protein F5B21DRAFT_467733 [Xylaria acuta]
MNTKMESQGTELQREVVAQGLDDVGMLDQPNPPSIINSPEGSGSEDRLSDFDHYSDSSGDEGPQNSTMVGRRIAQAFQGDSTDVVTDDDSIFNVVDDDDLDDEGAGSYYEELNFPAHRSQLERVEYISSSSEETDPDILDDAYMPSSGDEDEEYEEGEEGYDEGEEYYEEGEAYYEEGEEYYGEDEEYYEEDEEYAGNAKDGVTDPKSIAAHEPAELFANLQKFSLSSGMFSLNQSYERARWRWLELWEIKYALEKEIAKAEEKKKRLKKKVKGKHGDFYMKASKLGISRELWDEYQAFCESMEPEFGSANGWSIACDEYHQGSYVKYDPEFSLFKEYCELPWSQYNFRCEPGMQPDQEATESVVEFWPVAYPSTIAEDTSTWGDIYPTLYDLAMEAARDGSEGAIDMIVALPDREASCKGGWLFEYYTKHPDKCRESGFSVTNEGLRWTQNPVRSRRWHYRSAHKIDAPEDAATKQKRIQLSLKPAE